MIDYASNLMIYSRLFTCHLIQLKIIKWIFNYLKKFLVRKLQNEISSQKRSSSVWLKIKRIVKNIACFNKFINITNIYVDIYYWLIHFKVSITIVISKPNKELYDSFKVYQPIILLNTISKLFEKIISERLQFLSISNNFIHSC